MDQSDVTMKCRRCRANKLMKDLRMAPEGGGYVCRECLGQTEDKRIQKKAEGKVVAYRCGACGFQFTRKTIKPAKCPYCAKDAVQEAANTSSEKLLEES